jgi:hypothetical protein
MRELMAMLDYRLHYAIMANEDRTRPTHKQAWAQNRGVKRVFRIGEERPTAARDAGRR